MGLHVLPFGRAAWEKRRDIMRGIIAARPGPPYDFRDALWLVPNERGVLALRALFLDALRDTAGADGCIPPRISALNRVIETQAARASAKPVVDHVTRTLAIEELARSAASKRRDTPLSADALAPAAAPLIASALDALYTWGVPDGALRAAGAYSLPASLLADVKRDYERWLGRHALADPAGAAASLGIGPEEFAGYRTVVLDGFYDADPVELRVMKALSGVPEFEFVLEAPGLGMDGMSGEGMPYYGTGALLAALGLTLPDGPRSREDAEAEALSAALFGGRLLTRTKADIAGLGSLSSSITIAGAVNETEEAHYVAAAIKDGVISGGIPDTGRVAVWLTEPDSQLPAFERVLAEAGIPYHYGSGGPLMQSPVSAALMRLLSVPLDGYAFADIRAALGSPLIRLAGDGNHPEAFARFGRTERISRGRRAWLERLGRPARSADDAALVRAPLTRLFELLSALPDGRARLGRWCAAVKEIITGSGIAETVAERSSAAPELAAALAEITKALDALTASAARLSSTMTLTGFLYVLRKTLGDRRYMAGDRGFAGVRLLGGLELISEPFDVMFVTGLKEGGAPRSYEPDLFFGANPSIAQGMPGRAQHDSREARRFLSALTCAGEVHLIRPENGDRGPLPPSPYIRALRPFVEAGLIMDVTKWCRPAGVDKAVSPAGAIRALAMTAALPGCPDGDALISALKSLPQDTPGLDRALAALAPGSTPRPPSPPQKREFSVTEIEEYLLCHYRYYHDKLLGNAPVQDPEDDIAPHEAGSVVHKVLGKFYEDAAGPVTEANRETELVRLRGIADTMFGALPDTLPNRELMRRFTGFIAPRFIDTELKLTGSGYTLCGFELPVRLEVTDDVHGSFVLTGKIDRVELAADGSFAVVDYKTGGYPGYKRPMKELFQLPLYAYMLREGREQLAGGRAAERPVGFVYYNLKEGTMRDVVLYEADAGITGADPAKRRRRLDADALDGRVKEAFDKAVGAVRDILAGRFEPTCEESRVCERCICLEVCERGTKLADAGPEETEEGVSGGED